MSDEPVSHELELGVVSAGVVPKVSLQLGDCAGAGIVPMLGLAISGAAGERSPAGSALAKQAGFLHVTYDAECRGSAGTLKNLVGRSQASSASSSSMWRFVHHWFLPPLSTLSVFGFLRALDSRLWRCRAAGCA